MPQVSCCPKCHRQISLPIAAQQESTVRCPLCNASYRLSEALNYAPPMLEVVAAATAVSAPAPAADPLEMLGWDEPTPHKAQPETSHAEEAEAMSAEMLGEEEHEEHHPHSDHDLGGAAPHLPPAADEDWFPSEMGASSESELAEEEFADMGEAAHAPVAFTPAKMPSKEPASPSPRPRRRRPVDGGGSAIGKLISITLGLVFAVLIVMPASWWIMKKDVFGIVDKPCFPSFLSFALPEELKKQMKSNKVTTTPPPSTAVAQHTEPPKNPADDEGNAKPPANAVADNGFPTKEFDPNLAPKAEPDDPNAPKLGQDPDNAPIGTQPPDIAKTEPGGEAKPEGPAMKKPGADVEPKVNLDTPPDPLEGLKPGGVNDPFANTKPPAQPADQPEPKPETPHVGLKNNPVFAGPTDFDAALKAAEDAAQVLDSAEKTDPNLKALRQAYFKKLYALTAKDPTGSVDAVEAKTRLEAIRKLAFRAGDGPDQMNPLGLVAAYWFAQPQHDPQESGIVIAGTLKSVEKRGDLTVAKITFAGTPPASKPADFMEHEVVAKDELGLGSLAPGASVVLVGAIVDDPLKNIDGFSGIEERVIWAFGTLDK